MWSVLPEILKLSFSFKLLSQLTSSSSLNIDLQPLPITFFSFKTTTTIQVSVYFAVTFNNMVTNDIETNSNHEEQQEPVIKQEPFDKWELPRQVDLISDDGSQDDHVAISGNERAQTTTSVPQTGANPARASEKKRVASRADLMALQQKLADKYRTQNPNKPANKLQKQRQPEPEPELESESESEDENAKYEQARKSYMRKFKANKLSVEEEIAFIKMESDHAARQRKAEADAEYDRSPTGSDDEDDNDSGLFIAEDEPRLPEVCSDDESHKPKKRIRVHDSDYERPQKKCRSGKKVPGQNYTEDDLTEIIRGARRQKNAKSKQKAATKAKPKPKAPSNPKSKKKGGQETQITNLSNLFGGDVFRDHAATACAPSQPTFSDATRKADAMKKLIASVPQESVHVSRADMRHLHAAMKEFTGQGSVHAAPDGNWAVKGMKTTLKHFQILGSCHEYNPYLRHTMS